jgi:hypothetical protein
MQRLRDYARFLVWSSGLGYIALWATTVWTVDYGAALFANSGVCRPDPTRELFYWACDPASPLTMLAALANTALTFTLWAPVYVAAAIVQPRLIVIAAPLAAAHVIGLPAALLVTIRSAVAALAGLRRLLHAATRLHAGGRAGGASAPQREPFRLRGSPGG